MIARVQVNRFTPDRRGLGHLVRIFYEYSVQASLILRVLVLVAPCCKVQLEHFKDPNAPASHSCVHFSLPFLFLFVLAYYL